MLGNRYYYKILIGVPSGSQMRGENSYWEGFVVSPYEFTRFKVEIQEANKKVGAGSVSKMVSYCRRNGIFRKIEMGALSYTLK